MHNTHQFMPGSMMINCVVGTGCKFHTRVQSLMRGDRVCHSRALVQSANGAVRKSVVARPNITALILYGWYTGERLRWMSGTPCSLLASMGNGDSRAMGCGAGRTQDGFCDSWQVHFDTILYEPCWTEGFSV